MNTKSYILSNYFQTPPITLISTFLLVLYFIFIEEYLVSLLSRNVRIEMFPR